MFIVFITFVLFYSTSVYCYAPFTESNVHRTWPTNNCDSDILFITEIMSLNKAFTQWFRKHKYNFLLFYYKEQKFKDNSDL